jgi:hypothetical protein
MPKRLRFEDEDTPAKKSNLKKPPPAAMKSTNKVVSNVLSHPLFAAMKKIANRVK